MKNHITVFLLLAIIMVICVTCASTVWDSKINRIGAQVENETYKSISVEEAKSIINKKNVYLLDVREMDEYAQEHIAGSINVPLSNFQESIKEVVTDKESIVIIYCASGVRSTKASRMLSSMGYTHVFDLGGIKDWPYEKWTAGEENTNVK